MQQVSGLLIFSLGAQRGNPEGAIEAVKREKSSWKSRLLRPNAGPGATFGAEKVLTADEQRQRSGREDAQQMGTGRSWGCGGQAASVAFIDACADSADELHNRWAFPIDISASSLLINATFVG